MFCHKCGANITDEAKFCGKCGTMVSFDNNDYEVSSAAETHLGTNAPKLSDTHRNDAKPQVAIPHVDTKLTDYSAELVIENVKGIAFFPTAAVDVFVDNVKLGSLSTYGTSSFKISHGQHCLIIGTRSIWVNIPKDTDSVRMTFKWNRLGTPTIICEQSELLIQPPTPESLIPSPKLCCPNCHSENLFPITESETTVSGGGYGFLNGCCGLILLGPFGLLCGLCGREKETKVTNRQFWVCQSCGNKFRDANDEYKEITRSLAAAVVMIFLLTLIVPALFEYFDINFLWLPPLVYRILGVLAMIVDLAGIAILTFLHLKE